MKFLAICAAMFAVLLILSGCDSNPTNAPSKEDVVAADKKRAAAIDNNPNLTQEQKDMQKRMMGLLPGGRNPSASKPGS